MWLLPICVNIPHLVNDRGSFLFSQGQSLKSTLIEILYDFIALKFELPGGINPPLRFYRSFMAFELPGIYKPPGGFNDRGTAIWPCKVVKRKWENRN